MSWQERAELSQAAALSLVISRQTDVAILQEALLLLVDAMADGDGELAIDNAYDVEHKIWNVLIREPEKPKNPGPTVRASGGMVAGGGDIVGQRYQGCPPVTP